MNNFNEPDSLYDVPLAALGLSEESIRLVEINGITSIGDCLDVFTGATFVGSVPIIAGNTRNDESSRELYAVVFPLLEKHGYWPRKIK